MFVVAKPQLVIAQCKAGIVGSFPSLSTRMDEQFDAWLGAIDTVAHCADLTDRLERHYHAACTRFGLIG